MKRDNRGDAAIIYKLKHAGDLIDIINILNLNYEGYSMTREITLSELRRDFYSKGEIFKQVESHEDYPAIECLIFNDFVWWVKHKLGMKIVRGKN